jgi:hypothetical protein
VNQANPFSFIPVTTPLEPAGARPQAGLLGIPPYVYAVTLSSCFVVIGVIWDISWHISIGRDGLFSAPHLAIYLGAVVSGCFSGYQVLKTTFAGTPAEKAHNVRFWGVFYSSLGALFCIWGAFAMLTSAPFDDWWHNTYGLDVKILSPPHTVLVMGIVAIQFGAMFSVLALQNREDRLAGWSEAFVARRNDRLRLMYVITAGLVLTIVFVFNSESMGRHAMHHSGFYQLAAGIFPVLLVAVARSSKLRWAVTATTVVYMVFMCLVNWVLQLFPAQPLLGPILNHITHFQSYEFPLLLVVPALGMDWVNQRFAGRNDWLLACLLGIAFVVLLLAAQWPFGDFLMSPLARNWFFGQDSLYFGNDPNWEYRFKFPPWELQSLPDFALGIGVAVGIGFLSARVGLWWGNWMRNVQR